MATPPTAPSTIYDLRPPSDRRSQWRRLPHLTIGAFRMVRAAAPRELVTTIVLQLAMAGAFALQLLVGREVLEDLIAISNGQASATDLLPAFAGLVGAAILVGGCAALTQHQQRLLVELVSRHTLGHIVGTASTVDLASYEDPAFHDQLQRARTAATQRPIQMVNSVTTLLSGTLTSLGITFALATIQPLLIPLAALAGVPLLLTTLHNSRQGYAFEYGMTPETRERIYLIELLAGRDSAKEIRVFGATGFLRRRYDDLTDERLRRLRVFLRKRLGVSLAGTMAAALATTVALGSLVLLLESGQIDVAGAVTAGIAMQMLSSRLSAITGSLGQLVESSMFLHDFERFLQLGRERGLERPHFAAGPSQLEPQPFERLDVDGVSFVYPQTERKVLDDVSLTIGRGEVIALVGENGSGKTTLVKLICGLYRAQEGSIALNGRSVADLPPEALRSDMTVIFQDFVQYHLSVRDNIALGRVDREPDDASIREAARRSGADRFLERLPNGFETRLGRQFYGGAELSIGQWQRLALARAFYRGGDFLVLDEPTASLDPKAEQELFDQMRELSAGRSVLLVSHRFSSVRTADRIYVLEHGRITEAGSHDELVEAGAHYAELFRLQAAAYL